MDNHKTEHIRKYIPQIPQNLFGPSLAFVNSYLKKKETQIESANDYYAIADISNMHSKLQRWTKSIKKNPAYGRQSISRPMRIVAPIPQWGGPRIPQNQKN